jgi:hypothetical protein
MLGDREPPPKKEKRKRKYEEEEEDKYVSKPKSKSSLKAILIHSDHERPCCIRYTNLNGL